ncbi:ammonium transporter [Massilia sp. METH4]|uniref:ammonium transporter n=1 Tax=Massilia sp. METH4 TaxID=3123041 RepID=UPI0030D50082
MKRFIGMALFTSLGCWSACAFAQGPVDKGDITWIMVATVLVILMAVPGLAIFYGGLVRSKNTVSVLTQTFAIFAVIGTLWAIYGYSLAFTEGNAFIGGTGRLFLQGVSVDSLAATFSKGVAVPEFAYIAFQMTFAAITPAIIIGGIAERAKFGAVLAFVVLWFTFSYLPLAHMVWFWAGPDAYTDPQAAEAATAMAGFLFQRGALDFAGGTVVHINSAVAALVCAFLIGKRTGYGRENMPPHSLAMTLIGGSLLWVGWFGFNVGSNLEANGPATQAFLNTFIAACAAGTSWMAGEWLVKGKPSLLGVVSGSIGGLVVITPACGFVGPMGALFMGLAGGIVCLWGVTGLKRLLGADDSLDVFGIHGVGGIFGALLTGVFAAPELGGTGVYDYVANKIGTYSMGAQVMAQAEGVVITLGWSGFVSLVAFKLVNMIAGFRVPVEQEREGLDLASHGETAYH